MTDTMFDVPAGMAVIAKTYEEKCEVVHKLAFERLFGILRQREPSLAGYGILLLDTDPTPLRIEIERFRWLI